METSFLNFEGEQLRVEWEKAEVFHRLCRHVGCQVWWSPARVFDSLMIFCFSRGVAGARSLWASSPPSWCWRPNLSSPPAADVALNSCLCYLMGRARIGAHANLPRWIRGKKQATASWKSPRCIFSLSQASEPDGCLFLMRMFCSVLFLSNLRGCCRFFSCIFRCSQFFHIFYGPNVFSFLILQPFFLFIANRVFRAEETLRSVEPCQLLSKPLRQELKTTVKPQQAPVEQADTLVEVDVRSSFIVQVCIQPNRDWTWKAHSKAWLLFFLPRWNPHRSSASIKDNNPKQMIVRVESEERHKQEWDVEAKRGWIIICLVMEKGENLV